IAIEAARRAKAEKCFAPALKQVQTASERLGKMHPDAKERFLLTYFLNPDATRRFLLKVAEAESQKEMVVAAIALKRHQLRHGKFPDDLSALTPEFLAEVPRDWMDGQPLRYRLKDDSQFVLYSIGENGVDDGGDPTTTHPEIKSYNFSW